jgi:oligoribonuclease
MSINNSNLIWIDLEMTGLDTQQDAILEIATLVTDADLNILAEGPVLAITQPEDSLRKMDHWCQKQHGKSGLLDRVRASQLTEAQAEVLTLEFLKEYIPAGKSPMCGNSICQDRRFLHRVMPKLENYFHYRNLDVSTLKELAKRWAPDVAKSFKKKNVHLALADICESIEELQHYREHLFNHDVFKK